MSVSSNKSVLWCVKRILYSLLIPGTNGTGVSEVNCPFGLQGTNYCLSCDPGFYLHDNTCLEIEQMLFYQFQSSNTLYKYGIKPTGEGLYLEQFQLPYVTSEPYIVFNSDLKVVEIIGDWNNMTPDHYHMSIDGEFKKIDPTLYVADYSFIVFTPNVGTISIAGGTRHNQAVYIITQKSDWDTISDNYLSDLPGNSKWGFGITTHQNSVFLVGGDDHGEMRRVRSINFDGVTNFNQAKARTWSVLGELETGVADVAVEFYNSKLLVINAFGNGVIEATEMNSIQVFDLLTGQTSSIRNVFESGPFSSGLIWPMIFSNDYELTVIGGSTQLGSSIEQHFRLEDLSVSRRVDVSESVFQALVASDGLGRSMSFTIIKLNV